jgi:hypothetical protein
MADIHWGTRIRVFKLTQDYEANANIPGVLRPYQGEGTGEGGEDQNSHLDMLGGFCDFFFMVNNVYKSCGKNSTDGVFYPGTSLTGGDVKCTEALSTGDVIVVFYGPVSYGTDA